MTPRFGLDNFFRREIDGLSQLTGMATV